MEARVNVGKSHNVVDEMADRQGVKSLDAPLSGYFSEAAAFGGVVESYPGRNVYLQGGRFGQDLLNAEQSEREHYGVGDRGGVFAWKGASPGENMEQRLDVKNEASTLEKRDEDLSPLDPKKKANEWRNELLSFPQLFNQAFLSLYRYNEYIDQRWSILDESHKKLYDLLLQVSKSSSPANLLELQDSDSNSNNIFISEKCIHNEQTSSRCTNNNYNYFHHLGLNLKVTNVYISGTELSNESKIQENEYKVRLYEDIYNRFQTCKNDIEITFERKSEIVSELDSKIKRIVSSIEKFINNNQSLIESHIKPLYNIDNSEIGEIGVVKRKTGVRGRPPGSGNRGRPPGSTKKAKKNPI